MRSEEELAELTKIAQQLEEELDRWDRWQVDRWNDDYEDQGLRKTSEVA